MSDSHVGYQRWQKLLFLHWRVAPNVIQEKLPRGLEVETFDGDAWLGVVPFSMERVRPWWSPPVPGISWFLETNLRTYVRHENGDTGVWFFSLDANHRLAVSVARRFWHLNYRFGGLKLEGSGSEIHYSGVMPDNEYEIDAVAPNASDLTTAEDRTLEYFLLERYRLFAQRPDQRFLTGLVHHEPYRFATPTLNKLEQKITDQVSPDIKTRAPDHVAWSPGVDVAVSALELLAKR